MKFIALLLSVMALLLTVIPCCELEAKENHTHQIEQKKVRVHNETDDNCCKDCSPFYVCGTCTGFAFTGEFVWTYTFLSVPFQHNTIYIPFKLTNPSVLIWQPPKLS
ncbi:DUF6660 family protein [Pedobacter cryoconitis]|uniref:DUF6660 family protein n=1 Tax=Pedobacter cryoconitis TaxID=188932 RepID=UPI0011B943DC|nr:DUF6660 family protein [Pedobacter cryoconitis]